MDTPTSHTSTSLEAGSYPLPLSRILWKYDPRMRRLAPRNRRLLVLIFLLAIAATATLFVIASLVGKVSTGGGPVIMDELRRLDFGGLEKEAASPQDLARSVKRLAEANQHAKFRQDSVEAFLGELNGTTRDIEQQLDRLAKLSGVGAKASDPARTESPGQGVTPKPEPGVPAGTAPGGTGSPSKGTPVAPDEGRAAKDAAPEVSSEIQAESDALRQAATVLAGLHRRLSQQVGELENLLQQGEAANQAREKRMSDQYQRMRSALAGSAAALLSAARGAGGNEDKDQWAQRTTGLGTAVGDMLELAERAAADERAAILAVADQWLATCASLRAQGLRSQYVQQVLPDMVGSKVVKLLNERCRQWDDDARAIFLPEVVGPLAGLPAQRLGFAAGHLSEDLPSLRRNWESLQAALGQPGDTPGMRYAREFVPRALQAPGGQLKAEQVVAKLTEHLKAFDLMRESYLNPVTALLAEEQEERALEIFLVGLRKALENQQPYVQWALTRFGERLLREAVVQPPALAETKVWQRHKELEKPFQMQHDFECARVLDYQKTVLEVYPDVNLYPNTVAAFSCSAEKAGAKTRRKMTIELEPGSYFLSQGTASDEELLVHLKGKYALEVAPVLIVSAPFGFFLDVPYGEADGYWCTPVRGPIHRYDSRTGEAQGTALKLMSPDQTAWVKCDLIKDRSKVWSEGEVKAVIKFLNGLEEKSDQP